MSLENIKLIQNNIKKLSPKDHHTQLIIVSKNQPLERLIPLLQAEYKLFGENKVQEALDKWPDLKTQFPDLTLFLLGPLQKNKVTKALPFFDVICCLDSKELAQKCAQWEKEHQTKKRYFIQVNTGLEPQKSGVLPCEFEELFVYASQELGLNIEGLQVIPPHDQASLPHFIFLKNLQKRYNIPKISMGMSQDYELALPLMTDYIRIGRSIFNS